MNYTKDQIESYKKYLKSVASISNLFSEREAPLLHSRTTEYLYCKVFGAENISRSDVTIDAQLGDVGIGIKTFGYEGKSSQEKIAEFNFAQNDYRSHSPLEMVKHVATLRNERIAFVERMFGVKKNIYHCIARASGKIFVFEEPMPKINIKSIVLLDKSRSDNVVNFSDGQQKYAFNISKSTLYKYFVATPENTILSMSVNIMEDPLAALESLHSTPEAPLQRLVLPLYGTKRDGTRLVYEKSGMNRWRASGEKRPRRYGEAEIAIYKEVKKIALDILPPRKEPFSVILPNGDRMLMSVSQDNGKALMSNPETALGTWLLGKIGMRPNEPLTYERLQELGFDSVELTFDGANWNMDLCKPGTYEDFLDENSLR